MVNIDDEILTAYLVGELPNESKFDVETWIVASEENLNYAEQFYFILKASDYIRVKQAVNIDESFKQLKKRFLRKKNNIIGKMFNYFSKVAAVLFFPLLLMSIYLLMPEKKSEMQFIEVRAKPGMTSSFELPDGTKVWLNAESSLKYPLKFSSNKRELQLVGQAYFEVVKDESKPFIVSTINDYSIEVLGTVFNVSAYGDDNVIETVLVRGSVKLNVNLPEKKILSRTLRSDERAIYDKYSHKMQIQNVNTEYYTAWKDGKIIFRNHPMERVLKILSRYYNVEFDVKDKRVYQSKITGYFENEQLPQILEYIHLANGIKYKINKPSVTSNNTLKINTIEISI